MLPNRTHHKPPETQPTPSLGTKIVGGYFWLIFAVWPLAFNFITVGSLPSRLPLLVGIAMIAVALKEGRKMKQILVPAQLFMAFSFFWILSSTYGYPPMGLLEGAIGLVRNAGMGAALLLTIRSVTDLNFFLRVFVWYAVTSTCYGLLFMVPGLISMGSFLVSLNLPEGKLAGTMRMIGLLNDPTYFGLSLIPAFLISLDAVIRTRNKHVKNTQDRLAIGTTMLIMLGIALSFSRTSWAATAAGILVLTGFQGKIIRSVFTFVIIVVFLQVATPDEFIETMISKNSERTTMVLNEKNDTRSGIWQGFLRLATNTPWGYGLGSIEYLRMLPSTFPGHWFAESPRPHNIYLFIWVESGIQTLFPLLALLVLSFIRSWKVRNYVDPETGVAYGPLSMALIASVTVGLFGLGGLIQILIINIALGLVVWYLKIEKKLVHVSTLSSRRQQ